MTHVHAFFLIAFKFFDKWCWDVAIIKLIFLNLKHRWIGAVENSPDSGCRVVRGIDTFVYLSHDIRILGNSLLSHGAVLGSDIFFLLVRCQIFSSIGQQIALVVPL